MPLHKVLLGCSLASLLVPQGWGTWGCRPAHPRWVRTRASRLSEALWAILDGEFDPPSPPRTLISPAHVLGAEADLLSGAPPSDRGPRPLLSPAWWSRSRRPACIAPWAFRPKSRLFGGSMESVGSALWANEHPNHQDRPLDQPSLWPQLSEPGPLAS